MLPKHLRLPARLIPLLAYKGRRLTGENLEIRTTPLTHLTHPLLAITVTTKVSKSAVTRNRIRRQLKAHIEALADQGRILPGHYLILVRTPNAIKADLISELEKLIAPA